MEDVEMTRGLNGFLKGLKFEGGETSQIEVAEEAIKKELFIIMQELNLQNGQTVKMNNIVQLISNKLGINTNKMQIAQIVMKVFQTGNYTYKINDNGDVEASFSTADILQREYEKQVHEEAEAKLHQFIQQTEQYANQLEQQNVKVTELNLQGLFSQEEQERNSIWIDLAIDHVLQEQNQER